MHALQACLSGYELIRGCQSIGSFMHLIVLPIHEAGTCCTSFGCFMTALGGKTGAESGGHDWPNILGEPGLIKKAHLIAGIAHKLGLLMMLVAYAWGAALLYFQFCNSDSGVIGADG